MFIKKKIKIFIFLLLSIGIFYGAGRLYFQLTDGFALSEIQSDLITASPIKVQALTANKQQQVNSILSQNFYYLGKGLQSYVFASEDGEYVLKFLKYRHLRPREWLSNFSFIEQVKEYQDKKIEEKKKKLEEILASWRLSYEILPEETAVLFVHLNLSSEVKKVTLFDKLGQKLSPNIEEVYFLIQKRASSYTKRLEALMEKGEKEKAIGLIDQLFDLLLKEYGQGIGDTDHALMQNTGVLEERVIHVDVGGFVRDEQFKEKAVLDQEMFNQTYRLKRWLKKKYPVLGEYLEKRLFELIGIKVDEMRPRADILNFED